MDKKKYMTPEVEVVTLKAQQYLLAGSLVGTNVLTDDADLDLDVLAPEMDLSVYFDEE